MMDEFLTKTYIDIIERYIVSHQITYLKDHISFCIIEQTPRYKIFQWENKDYIGKVTIWANYIIEEQISDHSQTLIFYLHYKLNNLHQFMSLFQNFYYTLSQKEKVKHTRIAICCSGGLSSSLLVTLMKEVMSLQESIYDLDALGISQLRQCFKDYDAIYLAPQIAYMHSLLLQETHHSIPIFILDPTDYATKDFDAILKALDKNNKMTL